MGVPRNVSQSWQIFWAAPGVRGQHLKRGKKWEIPSPHSCTSGKTLKTHCAWLTLVCVCVHLFVQITHQHECVKSRGSRLAAAYTEHDHFHSLTSVKNTLLLSLHLAETCGAATKSCSVTLRSVPHTVIHTGGCKRVKNLTDKVKLSNAEAFSFILFRQCGCSSCFALMISFLL